jgi:hypothetical protein
MNDTVDFYAAARKIFTSTWRLVDYPLCKEKLQRGSGSKTHNIVYVFWVISKKHLRMKTFETRSIMLTTSTFTVGWKFVHILTEKLPATGAVLAIIGMHRILFFPDIRPDTWLVHYIFGKISNKFIKTAFWYPAGYRHRISKKAGLSGRISDASLSVPVLANIIVLKRCLHFKFVKCWGTYECQRMAYMHVWVCLNCQQFNLSEWSTVLPFSSFLPPHSLY